MKVEVKSKKGLRIVLSVIVDKKNIQIKMNDGLNELQKEVALKGFRPGKVPPSVIKSQFGKSIYGEVIDKILKESSSKAISEKKSPIYPDDKHLHMLSFYKISNSYGKIKSNYLNSIVINLFYLILIIPGLYLLNDPQLSRYWFFALLLIYLVIYSRLYRFTKN